jgi:hypothetical protein
MAGCSGTNAYSLDLSKKIVAAKENGAYPPPRSPGPSAWAPRASNATPPAPAKGSPSPQEEGAWLRTQAGRGGEQAPAGGPRRTAGRHFARKGARKGRVPEGALAGGARGNHASAALRVLKEERSTNVSLRVRCRPAHLGEASGHRARRRATGARTSRCSLQSMTLSRAWERPWR